MSCLCMGGHSCVLAGAREHDRRLPPVFSQCTGEQGETVIASRKLSRIKDVEVKA